MAPEEPLDHIPAGHGGAAGPPSPANASLGGLDGPHSPTSAQLQVAAETFAMLSTPTRLHLVWLLAQSDHDVTSLAERVGVPVATVSQHLAKLRFTGLVRAHRQGRRQIYSVDDPHVVTLVDQIFRHIGPDGTLAPDPTLPPTASAADSAVGTPAVGPLSLPQPV